VKNFSWEVLGALPRTPETFEKVSSKF